MSQSAPMSPGVGPTLGRQLAWGTVAAAVAGALAALSAQWVTREALVSPEVSTAVATTAATAAASPAAQEVAVLATGLLLLALLAIGLLVWRNSVRAAAAWEALRTALASRCDEDLQPLTLEGPWEARCCREALNAWMERLRRAEERRQRLLGDASHQLRTPLAVLRTVLQSTAPEALGSRREELLGTVDRTTAVVDEMLARMKLDQRRADRAAAAPQRLDEVAREVAIECAPLIGAKRQRFSLDAAAVEVRADAWMLGELVRNLLANAVRHTPREGALGIVVRQAPGGPELIVWDSGPGLPEQTRDRLFEPFAAGAGGIGLGLSICRDLAQAMDAKVEIFNRTDGELATGVDAVVRWADPQPAHLPYPLQPNFTPPQGDTR